jgi:hypothetical protein
MRAVNTQHQRRSPIRPSMRRTSTSRATALGGIANQFQQLRPTTSNEEAGPRPSPRSHRHTMIGVPAAVWSETAHLCPLAVSVARRLLADLGPGLGSRPAGRHIVRVPAPARPIFAAVRALAEVDGWLRSWTQVLGFPLAASVTVSGWKTACRWMGRARRGCGP